MCKKIVLIFFLENRALKHIDELFGESTNSSESEEETIADVARGAKLKRQLSVRTRTIQEVEEESESEQQHVEMPPTPEIFPAERETSPQDWYSSGGDHQTTPRFSPQHSSIEESESEKYFNMYAALWKDRNIVPMLSMGFGVEHNTVNRGGGGPKKRGKLKGTKVLYG